MRCPMTCAVLFMPCHPPSGHPCLQPPHRRPRDQGVSRTRSPAFPMVRTACGALRFAQAAGRVTRRPAARSRCRGVGRDEELCVGRMARDSGVCLRMGGVALHLESPAPAHSRSGAPGPPSIWRPWLRRPPAESTHGPTANARRCHRDAAGRLPTLSWPRPATACACARGRPAGRGRSASRGAH